MDVTRLPFNQLLGLEVPPPDSGFLVSLPAGPQYANHLGTVHAGTLLAVAEAGSGAYLVRHLGRGEGFVPVVRRLEAKFRRTRPNYECGEAVHRSPGLAGGHGHSPGLSSGGL
jgi:acyl-coenzyme A thioesterase PaaI-like protein